MTRPASNAKNASPLSALAVVLNAPGQIELSRLPLQHPGEDDIVVDVEWSGISTGTERLFWSGNMPPFPGMGYPLVPGYETVGRVTAAGPGSSRRPGDRVFVPGARCFGPVRGLFGGAAERIVVPAAKAVPVSDALGERAVLIALAATAQHAIADGLPDLIVGHGVLGRLIARLTVLAGGDPVVWERAAERRVAVDGYRVVDATEDPRRDYGRICDVSGDSGLLDALIERLALGGEVVLAGFYSAPLSFRFPPAFLKEARLRVAAEWREPDLATVLRLAEDRSLSLDGLITHRTPATDAAAAYRTAFGDATCLKMILDWRPA